MQEANYIYSDN